MELIYRAMGWLMRQLFDLVSNFNPQDAGIVSNYSIALILLSIIIKLITMPLSIRQSQNMAKTQAIQPKIEEIQKKYGNDSMTIARKTQELYKEEKISPTGGCLPLLIQMPILLAMFRVVRDPMVYVFTEPGLYESINKSFLWVSNIAQPDLIMAAVSGIASFLYQQMMTKTQAQATTGDKEQQEAMRQSQRMMGIIMPVMMFFIYRAWPAALPLYITVNMIVTGIQQVVVNKVVKKDLKEEVS